MLIEMGEIEGMSEELQNIYLSNMDEAPARRLAREAFKDIQLTIDHCLFQVINFFSVFLLTYTYLNIKEILICTIIEKVDI